MAGVDSGISFGRPALLQVEPRSLLVSIGLHWLRLQYYTQVGPWGPLFGVMLLCSGVAPLLVRTIRRRSMVAFLCSQRWDILLQKSPANSLAPPGNLVTRIRIFSDFSLNSVIFRVHVPMANPKRGYGATSCGEGGLF